jgi:hypothetical protein
MSGIVGKTPRSGIAMIELAVATGCLIVLLGTVATLTVGLVRGVQQAEEETLALGIARGLLVELRARPDVPEGPETRPLPIPYEASGRLLEASAQVRWETWEPGLAKATVVLAWRSVRGNGRRIELVTLVGRGGPR